MSMHTTTQQNVATQPHSEQILVVKRTDLFPIGAWHGLQEVKQNYFAQLITQKGQFMPRFLAEEDPTYKQVIPYLIFTHNEKLFLMQRQEHASEQRLKSKMSLGIGGHIRAEDISGYDIAAWAQREFEEEIAYKGSYTIEPLGLLNDDTNPVGEVHAGFVYLLHGDSAEIQVKEELKTGNLLSLDECVALYDQMEPWSQIVLDFLIDTLQPQHNCCSGHE